MAKQNKKNGFNVVNRLKDQDQFGIPVTLNFNGSDSIKSLPGAIISLIIYVLLLAYAILQG